MTQFLRPEDCNEEFFVNHYIALNRPWRPLMGEPITQGISINVVVSTEGLRHRVPLSLLPLTIHLLAKMDWAISYEDYGNLICRRRHILLNEAVMANRRDVAYRYRQAARSYHQAAALWDAVKHLRAQPMDRRMMVGVAMFAASWPETAYCVYDGGSFEDFDGYHSAGPGEINIRFWPVVFQDESHNNTRGISIPMNFYIDEHGSVRHNFDSENEQPHPHAFTDGGVCNGEARFGESQLESLKQLHNWYVGTDHNPAGGDEWSGYGKDWWEGHRGDFFAYYNDRVGRQAYYILAPQTSMGYDSTYEDRQAIAQTLPLTETRLTHLLEEYGSEGNGEDEDDEDTDQCAYCDAALRDGEGYYCEFCNNDVCNAHYYGEDQCNECWTNSHTKCADCGDWVKNDDAYHCNQCGDLLCVDCSYVDENSDTYCLSCKRRGSGDWEEGDEEFNTDTTPVAVPVAPTVDTAPDGGPAWSQGWHSVTEDPHQTYTICTWPHDLLGRRNPACTRPVAYLVGTGSRCYNHVPRASLGYNRLHGEDYCILTAPPVHVPGAVDGVTIPAVYTDPYQDQYWLADEAERWECEWPGHQAYISYGRAGVCLARAIWVHYPRPDGPRRLPPYEGDDCHMLCEEHFSMLPVRAGVAPAPTVEPNYREFYIPMEPAAWMCRNRAFHGAILVNATKRRLRGGDPEFLCDACYAALPERGIGVPEHTITIETEWYPGETNLGCFYRPWPHMRVPRVWAERTENFMKAVEENEIYLRLWGYGAPAAVAQEGN